VEQDFTELRTLLISMEATEAFYGNAAPSNLPRGGIVISEFRVNLLQGGD